MRFSVLGSGSRGNAALVRAGGSALLIDLGIGTRQLEQRLGQIGESGQDVCAAVLTHTHSDHVGQSTLRWLADRGLPLYCHEAHRANLGKLSAFDRLESHGLVRHYDDRPWIAPNGMRIEPIPASHDDTATFGFRIEARTNGSRRKLCSLGYLADTGTWSADMAEALREVTVLGIEFNHDVALQKRSGRPAHLICRILGDRGHLSNDQGADLLEAVVQRSGRKGPSSVVLLHLSRDCNHPDLAFAAAVGGLRRAGHQARVHVAHQDSALCCYRQELSRPRPGRARTAARPPESSPCQESAWWPTFF